MLTKESGRHTHHEQFWMPLLVSIPDELLELDVSGNYILAVAKSISVERTHDGGKVAAEAVEREYDRSGYNVEHFIQLMGRTRGISKQRVKREAFREKICIYLGVGVCPLWFEFSLFMLD